MFLIQWFPLGSCPPAVIFLLNHKEHKGLHKEHKGLHKEHKGNTKSSWVHKACEYLKLNVSVNTPS